MSGEKLHLRHVHEPKTSRAAQQHGVHPYNFLNGRSFRREIPVSVVIVPLIAFIMSPAMVSAGPDSVPVGAKTRILVGADHDYPPYEFIQNGQPAGFNIELIKAVADVMGLQVEIKQSPWRKIREDLEQGRIDALAGMYYSKERDQSVDFSVPHTMVSSGLFVRENSTIHAFEGIRGREIVVQEGDIMHDYLKKAGLASGIFTVTDPKEALRLVASGLHDGALLSSEVQGQFFIAELGLTNLRLVRTDQPPRRYCFAVAEGNRELVNKLDEGLNILKATGKYGEIYEKWFGVYEKTGFWRTARYIVGALALVLVLLAASLLWSRTLKREVRVQTAESRRAVDALAVKHGELEETFRQLQQSRNILQLILESIPVRVFWKDRNDRYLGCNSLFARDAGFTDSTDIVGKSDYEMGWKEQADLYRADDRLVMESGNPKMDIVEPQTTPSGSRIWLSTSKVPLRNHDGSIFGVLGVYEDITERKRAEADRERLQAQLKQAQKMESIGRLAGGVAHDFNNMLGVIIGHAELALAETDPSQPVYSSLYEIRSSAERSAELTRQLLAFARKQTVVPRVLDLNEIVEGTLTMLGRLIGEDIDLLWLPVAGVLPIKIDPSQIDQVLANLCVNARDAIAGVGKVVIETRTVLFDEADCAGHPGAVPGRYAMLVVSDDGCGMDPETLENVFEPFFTTKERGKGTGLGLAMVYGIVTQNSGFITISSEPGKGTSFNIYLPVHGDEPAPLKPFKQAPAGGRGHETILLVEDEPVVLKMTAKMLERQGYLVLTAPSPDEALRVVKEQVGEIHLLLTDVIMPGMNGRDLVERIAALRPGIKSLFMSGYTADMIANRGVLEDGINFLQKPFSFHALASKVREALDGD